MYEDWHVKGWERKRIPPPAPDVTDGTPINLNKGETFYIFSEDSEGGPLSLVKLTPDILTRIIKGG